MSWLNMNRKALDAVQPIFSPPSNTTPFSTATGSQRTRYPPSSAFGAGPSFNSFQYLPTTKPICQQSSQVQFMNTASFCRSARLPRLAGSPPGKSQIGPSRESVAPLRDLFPSLHAEIQRQMNSAVRSRQQQGPRIILHPVPSKQPSNRGKEALSTDRSQGPEPAARSSGNQAPSSRNEEEQQLHHLEQRLEASLNLMLDEDEDEIEEEELLSPVMQDYSQSPSIIDSDEWNASDSRMLASVDTLVRDDEVIVGAPSFSPTPMKGKRSEADIIPSRMALPLFPTMARRCHVDLWHAAPAHLHSAQRRLPKSGQEFGWMKQ